MKKKVAGKTERKTGKRAKNKSEKDKETKAIEERTPGEEKKPIWKNNRYILVGVLNILLIIVALGFFYFYDGGEAVPKDTVNMSIIQDLGAVTIRGDGLPGYDINRNGEADYLSKGFGYYKGLYNAGGFEYGPGEITLDEFEVVILLPPLYFQPYDIVESSVGSVVSFNAIDENSDINVDVILKTLGPSLTTYNLIINGYDEDSYRIVDAIDADEGAGTIEEKEVEIAGKMVFRE
jgi:hypothetical protein